MAGRQPVDQRGPGVVISTKVHPDVKTDVGKAATGRGISLGAWVRSAILASLGQETLPGDVGVPDQPAGEKRSGVARLEHQTRKAAGVTQCSVCLRTEKMPTWAEPCPGKEAL